MPPPTNGTTNGTTNGAMNGTTNGSSDTSLFARIQSSHDTLSTTAERESSAAKKHRNTFHGDSSYGETFRAQVVPRAWAVRGEQLSAVLSDPRGALQLAYGHFFNRTVFAETAVAQLAKLTEESHLRQHQLNTRVTGYWDKMLHPPPSFLGDAFQYRQPDGKFNNVQFPHLGQGGAPYARTVPAKSRLLGAQPDPGVIFDKLLARQGDGLESGSGLSSMLLYHATIIIHDIFRTKTGDRNINEASSYLDLSPLYGHDKATCDAVRDRSTRRGLLKRDTFAEDRLLRQPPGACIMLVMYNRYHNYVARQLYKINENGRFQVPKAYRNPDKAAAAEAYIKSIEKGVEVEMLRREQVKTDESTKLSEEELREATKREIEKRRATFLANYDAVYEKLDDDLYNTARLITCGLYINISIHDYLRALMGFHHHNTDFTLDPRQAMNDGAGNKGGGPPRGVGNQVTVEFNVLYRFHCAISRRDAAWGANVMRQLNFADVDNISTEQFDYVKEKLAGEAGATPRDPQLSTFGNFKRDKTTKMYSDDAMVAELMEASKSPLGEFGPQNIPKFMRPIEVRGILQARKWEVGTLNDFREFFGMPRHKTFASVTPNEEIQDALRDLYEHPDKIELYPGVFCECNEQKRMGPGPANIGSTLWAAIFSDAITLVRSDRFYTTDWNTNTLTAWGMKEVTPDKSVMKGTVFHRLFQRAFPGRYPYNSVYFFHPFFTPKANEDLARAQGYVDGLNLNPKVDVKPPPPIIIKKFAEAKHLLTSHPHIWLEPASQDTTAILPGSALHEILTRRSDPTLQQPGAPPTTRPVIPVDALENLIYDYVDSTTRAIVEREVIRVARFPAPKPDAPHPATTHQYQVDIVRDVAIPVVVHLVAHFLNIPHHLRSSAHPHARLSENDLYRHITNCHLFFAHSADETKLLRRRAAFQASMAVLLELARESVARARPNRVAAFVGGLLGAKSEFAVDNNKSPEENLTNYGRAMINKIYEEEGGDVEKVAASIVLVALDAAFNTVLIFTSVLEYFLEGSTTTQQDGREKKREPGFKYWREIHGIATNKNKPPADVYSEIKRYVLEAQRLKLKLPAVRQAAVEIPVTGRDPIPKGRIVIIDINSAMRDATAVDPTTNQPIWPEPTRFNPLRSAHASQSRLLPYGHGLSEGVFPGDNFEMRRVSLWCITAMLTVVAQMQNLQPAPGTQGTIKRISIPVGSGDDAFKVRAYLSPEWDEVLPFPCTWKIRFDGYGHGLADLARKPRRHDDEYNTYELPGPSRWGGIFGSPPATAAAKPADAAPAHRKCAPDLSLTDPGHPAPGCGIIAAEPVAKGYAEHHPELVPSAGGYL